MAIAIRSAESVWEGSLAAGSGTLGGSDSGVLDGQSVTWEARTEQAGGKTSPEELCAAAHASCFSMALALMLGESGARPERLAVKAAVTLDEVDGKPTITTSEISVQATVPGIDDAAFQSALSAAAELCPVSRLFAGAQITATGALV